MFFFVSVFLFPPFEIVNQLTGWNELCTRLIPLVHIPVTLEIFQDLRPVIKPTLQTRRLVKWVETTQTLHSAQKEINQQQLLYFVVSFISGTQTYINSLAL